LSTKQEPLVRRRRLSSCLARRECRRTQPGCVGVARRDKLGLRACTTSHAPRRAQRRRRHYAISLGIPSGLLPSTASNSGATPRGRFRLATSACELAAHLPGKGTRSRSAPSTNRPIPSRSSDAGSGTKMRDPRLAVNEVVERDFSLQRTDQRLIAAYYPYAADDRALVEQNAQER